jgi:hypothetical protein
MSHGCGTRSLALRAECRLRESHNLLLRRIFGQEGGSKTSLQKPKHIIMTATTLCFYSNVVRLTKDRRARRDGWECVRSESEEKTYRVLAGRCEGRIPIETLRRKREDNIKKDFKGTG